MSVSPRRLTAAMTEAQKVRELLGDSDDLQLLVDCIEGESDVFQILDAIGERIIAAETTADLASARARRLNKQAERLRSQFQHILAALELPAPLERPSFDASLAWVPGTATVTDPAQLPAEYLRPDQTRLTARLRAGEEIPGAELGNGYQTLRLNKR